MIPGLSGSPSWSDLVFVVTTSGAVGAIIWALRDKLSERDKISDDALDTVKDKINDLKIVLFDRLQKDAQESQVWREGLGQRLVQIRDNLNTAISDSHHDLRGEINVRMLVLEASFDKLILEFVEHRAEDRGYFENLQMRVARLEPQPPMPIVKRNRT